MKISLEIVYRVKKGGANPLRPSLNIDPSLDLNPSVVIFIFLNANFLNF
jgi:hypothetical protein